MKTDITLINLQEITKQHSNGHIETIAGRVYWVWDSHIKELKGGLKK